MKRVLVAGLVLGMMTGIQANGASSPSGYLPAVQQQPTKTVGQPIVQPDQVPLQPMQVLSTYHHKNLSGLKAVEAANRRAIRQPLYSRYINAIMTYAYMPGALYQIYCAPLNVTDLQFEANEHIISVAAGDTLRWQVSRTFSGAEEGQYEHLLIKPIDSDLSNSLVVTTDMRTYHLQLHSTDSAYMASVKWAYPQSQDFVTRYQPAPSNRFGLPGLQLDKLDFDYEAYLLAGKKPSWMPWMTFNDGKKTYIQFPPNMQEAPALFVGKDAVHAQVVNYRTQGDYYIIDQVVKSIILRQGQSDPTVIQIVKK